MLEYFDIWKFLAGLGVFLFGLYFIEEALKNLVGRAFKKFLRNQTSNPFKGILAGTLVTAILQSSSIVTLMVLAFVGAGILTLKNAIGVILGSNLGTTFTGWIVASLGFNVDIESFALPMVAVGGISLMLFSKVEKLHELGRFLFGFGFLFIGLSWMKESIEYLTTHFDLSMFQGFNPYWFFLVGFILTAIIQSSSAAMVITLSSLNAGIIPLESAAAMVIGADLGTTITTILGGINGTAAKKQVAGSHFIFNLVADLIALVFLYPLLWLIRDVFGVADPLMSLVFFHSSFNLVGILIFLPFTGLFARLLQKWFKEGIQVTEFITRVPTNVPEAAIEALKNESKRFVEMVIQLNVQGMKITDGLFAQTNEPKLFKSELYVDNYSELKQMEGEIISFYLKLQNEKLEKEESQKLMRYIQSLRNAMHSAKGVKDVSHDIKEFVNSSNDVKVGLYELFRGQLTNQYLSFFHFIHDRYESARFETLLSMSQENKKIYDMVLEETYNQASGKMISEIELSTLLNMNREIYSANKALVFALSEIYLSEQEVIDFAKLPEMA